MLAKINIDKYWRYVKELRDVRAVGLLIFCGLVLIVTWSGIGVIQTNYDLQKKIAGLQRSVELAKLENSNLSLRNEYYETDQYLELQARRQFNKAKPGEKLLFVPETVALAHSVNPVTPPAEAAVDEPDKPFYQKNFEAWTDFLFRRNQP
jgi:cell division protein FtsB